MDKKPVMHRVMLWSIFVLLFFLGVVYFPASACMPMLAAALLALPIEKLQKLFLRVFFRRWVQIIVILLLILIALVLAPAPSSPRPIELFLPAAQLVPADP